MFDTAFVLLVVSALLVVVGFCQPLAAYLKLPQPVLLGVVGVALGGFPAVFSQLGWSTRSDPLADIFVELPVNSATFIYVFLPLLVFEAGIAISFHNPSGWYGLTDGPPSFSTKSPET